MKATVRACHMSQRCELWHIVAHSPSKKEGTIVFDGLCQFTGEWLLYWLIWFGQSASTSHLSSIAMRHPELPVVAFLTAFLVVIPLPWHWRARNVATVALMLWLFVVDIIYGVNAIIWAGNVNNPIPVWCDIGMPWSSLCLCTPFLTNIYAATKILVGASYALPLCTLCICKHLEAVSSPRPVSYAAKDKYQRIIFETVMCFGVPAIFMALRM